MRLNGVLGNPHVEKGLQIFVKLVGDVGSDEGNVAVAPCHLVAISFNCFRMFEYERVNQQHRDGQLTAEQVVVRCCAGKNCMRLEPPAHATFIIKVWVGGNEPIFRMLSSLLHTLQPTARASWGKKWPQKCAPFHRV